METTFEYDANGNLKWQTAPDGFKTRYTYDDYDRLISVVRGL
ncbi:MAG: RHS repeat domain-containing protein [Planctomycetota bacterium]